MKPKLPTLAEFIKAQNGIAFCQQATNLIYNSGTECLLNKEGEFIRRSTVDELLKKLVPQSLRRNILYFSHHPPLAGHPGKRSTYDNTKRRDYFWPSIAQDVYDTVSDCQSCADNWAFLKHKHHLLWSCQNRYLGTPTQDDERKSTCSDYH